MRMDYNARGSLLERMAEDGAKSGLRLDSAERSFNEKLESVYGGGRRGKEMVQALFVRLIDYDKFDSHMKKAMGTGLKSEICPENLFDDTDVINQIFIARMGKYEKAVGDNYQK